MWRCGSPARLVRCRNAAATNPSPLIWSIPFVPRRALHAPRSRYSSAASTALSCAPRTSRAVSRSPRPAHPLRVSRCSTSRATPRDELVERSQCKFVHVSGDVPRGLIGVVGRPAETISRRSGVVSGHEVGSIWARSISIACFGTTTRRPSRRWGRSPRATSSYACAREIPNKRPASSTDHTNDSRLIACVSM